MLTLSMLLPVAAVSQERVTASGTVIGSSDQQPVVGAAVVESGTVNGTVTDLDGRFSLEVAAGANIEVSFLGFTTQTLPAAQNMNVVLQDEAQDLGEIVVTGYTTQRKADLTGSVAVVGTEKLRNTSEVDPMRALQGHVSGMTVTTNGSPSAASTVRIRGVGSFNSNQDPLYIIDGVPTTRALNSLNANDIESMQVLKDAASASIYGARAANGVIIITTKQGKKADKVNVDINANVSTQFYGKQSLMKLCNAEEYATSMVQAALNDGLDPVTYAANYGMNLNADQGFNIHVFNPKTYEFEDFVVNGQYKGEDGVYYVNKNQTMVFSDTDWLDAISQRGTQQSYDVSISNGTDRVTTMFSAGFKRNDGIIKHTDFKSASVRMNTNFKVSKHINVGENITATYSDQVDIAPMETALKMSPILPVYEKDGVTFSGPVGSMADRQNPAREAYQNKDNRLAFWRIFGNAYIEVEFIKGLKLKTNYGLDFYESFINARTHTFHSDIVAGLVASTDLSHSRETEWTWSNTLTYNNTFGRHTIGALLGFEANKQVAIGFNGRSEGYELEDINYMWPDAATGEKTVGGKQNGYRLASVFAKLDYNFNDLILFSATVRHDGSSRMGDDKRWGNFPALTLGFRPSKFIDSEVLSDLKLRVSWGKNGNQAIDNMAKYGIYINGKNSNHDTSSAYDVDAKGGDLGSGYIATQRANRDLKWEAAEQVNWGLDFGFFNSALYGSVDVFIKNVEDMLINPAFLGAYGEGGSQWVNGPSLKNYGMEVSLGYRRSWDNGWSLDLTGNLDFYRNRVTYIPEDNKGSYEHTDSEDIVSAEKPYGSRVGYICDGLFRSQAEVEASGQSNARLGGLKYRDLNNDGKIDGGDVTWIFNPVPKMSWGLNIGVAWKSIDFSAFLQGVAGVDVYNNQKIQTDFWGIQDTSSNKGERVSKAWNINNQDSDIPRLTTMNSGDEGRQSSYFVENGSYMKLRNLQLGYSLPEKAIGKLHMTKARIYVAGQNLATAKSKDLTITDPENADWNYPIPTSLSFGLSLSF